MQSKSVQQPQGIPRRRLCAAGVMSLGIHAALLGAWASAPGVGASHERRYHPDPIERGRLTIDFRPVRVTPHEASTRVVPAADSRTPVLSSPDAQVRAIRAASHEAAPTGDRVSVGAAGGGDCRKYGFGFCYSN